MSIYRLQDRAFMCSQTQPQVFIRLFTNTYLLRTHTRTTVATPSLGIVRGGVRHSLSSFGLLKCSLRTDKTWWEKIPSFTDYGRLWIFSSLVWKSFRRYLSPLKLGLVAAHGDQTLLEVIPCHVINGWKSWDHKHYQQGRLSIHPHLPAFIIPFFGIIITTLTTEKIFCGGWAQNAFAFLANNKIFPFPQIIFASSLR